MSLKGTSSYLYNISKNIKKFHSSIDIYHPNGDLFDPFTECEFLSCKFKSLARILLLGEIEEPIIAYDVDTRWYLVFKKKKLT